MPLHPVARQPDLARGVLRGSARAREALVVGTTGNMVIDAAVPLRDPVPAEATHAAPICAIDAVWVGVAAPFSIMSAMLRAT